MNYSFTHGKEEITEAEKIQRLINICKELVGIIKEFRVVYVGIEGFAHNAKWQSHQLGELQGAVKTQLAIKFGIIPEIVSPAAARKHVFGYGGSLGGGKKGKDTIKQIVRDGLGVDVKTGDEADAVIVGRYTFDKAVAREKEMENL